ncbi:MAG: GGDEF domain-containing protein [Clostridiales bacterium]|jgi:diguanylate cyclase (GGDEF)-like protein|nr:GGDEF domain-containing protein [Clostridiales bacterium]
MRIISSIFPKPQVPEELREYCANEASRSNRSKFKNLAPIIIVAVALILAVYLYSAVREGLDQSLLIYILTDAIYLVILVITFLLSRSKRYAYEKRFNIVLQSAFLVTLIWTIILSMLDSNMTCYIMAALLFPIAFVIKFNVYLILLLSALAPLLIMMPFTKMEGFTLLLNYINTLFGSFLSIYMCNAVYTSSMESISNKKLIEIKNAELSNLVVKLMDLSETDALTALLNRRKFNEIIESEWKRALRSASGLVFILFDIDYFKNYNDTYGHLKGDECLVQISKTIKEAFRRSDEYVARYGGEEFAIIMSNSSKEEGQLACKRLLNSISELKIPHRQSKVSDIVTLSAGMVMVTPAIGDSLEDYINKADMALYEAKKAGRNRYVVWGSKTSIKNL